MGSVFDAEATWSLLGDAAREALARAGAAPGDVLGVAATSMRHGSVLLDAQGRVLLATPNRDARGLAPALELAARHGDALHQRTGHWPNPVQPAGPPALAREPRPRAARARGLSPLGERLDRLPALRRRGRGAVAGGRDAALRARAAALGVGLDRAPGPAAAALPRRARRRARRLGALTPAAAEQPRARGRHPGRGRRRRHAMRSARRGRGRARRARRDRGHLVARALAGRRSRGSIPRRGCGRCRT